MQHNDTQHNLTQNAVWHYPNNDTQLNLTHKLCGITLLMTIVTIKPIMLRVITLVVILLNVILLNYVIEVMMDALLQNAKWSNA